MRLRFTACLLALALSACASGGHASNGSNRNVITAEEITNAHETNAYAVIRSLRPNMLAVHGPTSISNQDPGIVVFLDGQRYGDVDALKELSTNNLAEIRFLTPGESQYRYGTGFPEGIIEVKSKGR
jgi:hypothetical protein